MKKFNFLDVLIVLAVVAVIAAGAWFLWGNSGAEQKTQASKIIYMVEDEDALPAQAEAVKVGDRVNIGVNGADSSVVTAVESVPAEKVEFNSLTGVYEKKEIPNRCTLRVTCEAEATVSDMEIKAGGTPIRVGAEFTVKGQGYLVTGYVLKTDLAE